MKKNRILVVIVALVAMIIGACNTVPTPDVPSYEDGMRDQCFELGGLLDKNANCVLVSEAKAEPQAPAADAAEEEVQAAQAQALAQAQPVAQVPEPTTYETTLARCQSFALTFGKMGSFHGEYDSIMQTCVIGIWESSRVENTAGISLADLKVEGDKYTIIMPFDGYVNHSAETVLVNAKECIPGNPVKCASGQTLFTKGTPVEFITHSGNNSSGPMLIEAKP